MQRQVEAKVSQHIGVVLLLDIGLQFAVKFSQYVF
jgi:hypothetical protein